MLSDQPKSDGPRLAKIIGAGGIGCGLMVVATIVLVLLIFIVFDLPFGLAGAH